MSIKDCFSKKWISYEFSRTCTARDCIKAVEKAYAIRFPDGNPDNIILRTDNGPKYTSEIFKNTVKILGIRCHERSFVDLDTMLTSPIIFPCLPA